MLTREQVAAEYRLNEYGLIQDLGKFEGEHWSTVAFYDDVLNGCSDESLQWSEEGDCTDIFILSDTDRAAIGCNATEYAFLLDNDSQGFVSGKTVDRDTYDNLMAEYESRESAEPFDFSTDGVFGVG